MKRPQALVYSALASLVLLGTGVSQAQAGTITVTRGPNGASHLVNMDKIPADAQVQSTATLSPVLRVVQRGPNGAFQVAQDQSQPSVAASPAAALDLSRLMTRGSHGAVYLGK